jgi:hypothetical protein
MDERRADQLGFEDLIYPRLSLTHCAPCQYAPNFALPDEKHPRRGFSADIDKNKASARMFGVIRPQSMALLKGEP